MNQNCFSSEKKTNNNFKCHDYDMNCKSCYRYFYFPNLRGPQGETGQIGPQGAQGGIINYSDFYALMPPDNAATVAPGTDVSFPQEGPNN